MKGTLKTALAALSAAALALLAPGTAPAQELGHKFPGALGIGAGVAPPPGLYAADRLAVYSAEQARDAKGALLPIQGLNLDALSNSVGIQGTHEFAHGPSLSASFAAPLARVRLNSVDPAASVDRFGFGDVFLMPLKVGYGGRRFDLVSDYGLYIPTGHFEPGGDSGVGRGFWTHQLSLGGAARFDREGRVRASVLASYDHNLKKRGIDITRGDTVQLQGGAGLTLWKRFEAGLAGYALWQVEDDAGSDLPPALKGARDRVYGLGPEVSLLIPQLRTKLGARYEWDLAARSRPEGRMLVVSVDVTAWRPTRRPP